jgi:hypothetical protein
LKDYRLSAKLIYLLKLPVKKSGVAELVFSNKSELAGNCAACYFVAHDLRQRRKSNKAAFTGIILSAVCGGRLFSR